MDTSKIIRGVVSNGRYTVTAPIVKEDYGLYLQIEGVELPSTYEVDFSNSENNGTSVTMIGNADGVLIPSQFIGTGKDIFAFLYHVGEDFGRTVYKFRIPNKVRPDRTNEQPTPEEQSVIDQTIAALNEAVAQTAQDKADADASAQNASADADRAEEARTDAQNYATQAEQSATDAYTYALSANAASGTAGNYADVAGGYASQAQTAAQTATNKASAASQSATNASNSATTASTKAGEASASATTASNKASEASGYASTASQKATESAQSASQALSYKTDAESAKTASQTAQGLAESARDSAISAKTDAESARDEAQNLVDGISGKVEQIDSNTERIESLEDDRYKPYAVDSASGSIASFSDGADDLPLKSLVIDINPVQDLHGQEAPYPAGGGKNKVIYPYDSGSSAVINGVTFTVDSNGVITANGLASENAEFILMRAAPVTLAAGDWTISGLPSGGGSSSFVWNTYAHDSDNTTVFDRRTGAESYTFNCPNGLKYLYIGLRIISGYNCNNLKVYPQFESGSSATTFAPYSNICPISGWTQVDVNHSDADMTNPTTLTINLGQTVYGGKLDVLSGELVIDRAMRVFDGTESGWAWHNGYKQAYISNALSSAPAKYTDDYHVYWITNALAPIANANRNTNVGNFATAISGGSGVAFSYSADGNLDGFKAFAQANPIQFCYKLATPITIQLTSNQVNSLLGVNNLWADSGDTTCVYRADTKAYIAKKIAEAIASLT